MHAQAVLVDDVFVAIQPALIVPNESPCVVVDLRRLPFEQFMKGNREPKRQQRTQNVCMCPRVGILTWLSRKVAA